MRLSVNYYDKNSFDSDVLFSRNKKIKENLLVELSTNLSYAIAAMPLKLLSVEELLCAAFASVVLRSLFVDREQMLFQVVAGGEGFGAEVTLMISLVKVNPENVAGDA